MKLLEIPGTSKKLTWFIIISQAIMMGWSLVCAATNAGPLYAAIITYACFGVYIVYAFLTKSTLMWKLIIFGLAGGIIELWADHYSVAIINALVYPTNETMVVSSPLYMPVAWANVFVQLGYYSLLFIRWKGITLASIIMAVMGGMYIPFYEHFADEAGWWYYHNVSSLWSAPYYIIICESLISLTLPICMYFTVERKYLWALLLGIAEGIWILLSAMIAYSIAP
ncbi:MAG: hypothetical protein JXR03_17450 [Cyclobacteriaceae bacterium]